MIPKSQKENLSLIGILCAIFYEGRSKLTQAKTNELLEVNQDRGVEVHRPHPNKIRRRFQLYAERGVKRMNRDVCILSKIHIFDGFLLRDYQYDTLAYTTLRIYH